VKPFNDALDLRGSLTGGLRSLNSHFLPTLLPHGVLVISQHRNDGRKGRECDRYQLHSHHESLNLYHRYHARFGLAIEED